MHCQEKIREKTIDEEPCITTSGEEFVKMSFLSKRLVIGATKSLHKFPHSQFHGAQKLCTAPAVPKTIADIGLIQKKMMQHRYNQLTTAIIRSCSTQFGFSGRFDRNLMFSSFTTSYSFFSRLRLLL